MITKNFIKIWFYTVLSLLLALPFSEEQTQSSYRLPGALIPRYYSLSLSINPEEIVYTGTAVITLDAVNDGTINDIYIHADREYIAILTAVLNDDINCVVGTANEDHILNLNCAEGVTGLHNYLSIEFVSKFSEDGYGLVKSKYFEGEEEQFLIESNFKPTYARRAFPCFDEPDLIANYSIEITYPKEYTVISNTLVFREDTDAGNSLKTTTFAETPQISTYLVSILISKLEVATAGSDGEYEFKIFTRQEVGDLINTAVNYYDKILEALNDYSGIPYQNLSDSECYQVAVPDYSDAVGDFGLFIYRETDLLDDGVKTTERVTQDIITTMAYKLAHEWYGAIVATTWWSDVWANEAIATYLKYVIADRVDDNLRTLYQFVVEVTQTVLQYDAYPFAEPLSSRESDVAHTRDIQNKLNTLSYGKGASILFMIRGILGTEEKFQDALNYHLQQRKESNTDGSTLLVDLFANERDDLYSYLLPWIDSSGYPLVTVKINNYTEEGVEVLILSQKRFVYPTDNMANYSSFQWAIPLNSANLALREFDVRADTFLMPNEDMLYFYMGDVWLLFNVQMGFYYRVNYEEALWRRFITFLRNDTRKNDMHILSRAQLVDDVFSIARIGDVSYYTAFDLADYLVNEVGYYPWYSALNAFSYLIGKMGGPVAEENLRAYILELMREVLFYIQFDEITHINTLKQVMVIDWGCRLNHPGVVNYIAVQLESYKEVGLLTDYNLRGVVFCNAIRYSKNITEDWQFLWDLYTTTSSVQEQNDVLQGLGCAEDKDFLKAYLSQLLSSDSLIKKQDVLVVFKSIFSSSVGVATAVEFLEDNITEIASLGINILSEMLYTLAEKLMTDEELHWLAQLLSNDVFDDYPDVKSKSTTIASVNNYWEKNYQVQVREIFLTIRTTTTTTTTTTTSPPTTAESSGSSSESPSSVTTPEIDTTTEGKSERMYAPMLLIIFVTFLVLMTSELVA